MDVTTDLLPGADRLREWIEPLAALERESASPGERRAAELICDDLAAYGGRARLEDETVHGTYWWPLGILSAAGALAATVGGVGGAALGLGASAAAADEVAGRSRFRKLLPRKKAVNVVAEFGDPDARPTLVFFSHHDAAHPGVVFNPALVKLAARRYEGTGTTPPSEWGFVAAPAIAGLGALLGSRLLRFAGGAIALGHVAAMVDVGLRRPVPGANDNLSGVAVLLALAQAMSSLSPPCHVILLSTGSEESFMEGMRGFVTRHSGSLDAADTFFICVDTLGSPNLVVVDAEGTLGMQDFDPFLRAILREHAARLEIPVGALRVRNGSDAAISRAAGYRTAFLSSAGDDGLPTNYHWPTDTPDNVDYSTVLDAARLCWSVVRAAPQILEAMS